MVWYDAKNRAGTNYVIGILHYQNSRNDSPHTEDMFALPSMSVTATN
jgi:hypothetical protein